MGGCTLSLQEGHERGEASDAALRLDLVDVIDVQERDLRRLGSDRGRGREHQAGEKARSQCTECVHGRFPDSQWMKIRRS